MSPYTQTLAQLRLSALQALQDALNATTDPAELRRIAQAIFRAPPPDDDIDSALPIEDPQNTPDEPHQPNEQDDQTSAVCGDDPSRDPTRPHALERQSDARHTPDPAASAAHHPETAHAALPLTHAPSHPHPASQIPHAASHPEDPLTSPRTSSPPTGHPP